MLTINSRTTDDVFIIDLEGQIDGGDSSQQILSLIRDTLEAGGKKVLLNLAHVQWINSLGVGFLVASFVSARNNGATMRLYGAPGRVSAVLHACGVAPNIIGIFSDEEEALGSFS